MRYYIVCKSELEGIAPHIVAEVVRDRADADRSTTLAAALAGDRRVVATRDELLEHPLGREALKWWNDEDDSAYDDECAVLRSGIVKPVRALHLVKTAPTD